MEEFARYVVHGFPIGCVYALVAVGLVLTYKTSGVFNLAFGAQAFVSAAVFYDTRRTHEWPLWAAFGLAVLVVAPLLGVVLDRLVFRYLRTGSTLARLVCSLGLLVAIPGVTTAWFGTGTKYAPPSVAPDPDRVWRFGPQFVNADEMATIVVTLAVVVGLTLLFRFTTLGLRMRAVVESSRMVELAGVNADRIGTVAWALSSLLAGLAGVLLAPLFQSVDAASFTVLLVAAIAAAAFGRLSSIPLTLLGGILLGVLQQALAGYLPTNSLLAKNLRPSLPFLVLFLLLLFWPGLRQRREATDPLAGVDPPPPALGVRGTDPRIARAGRVGSGVLAAAVVALVVFVLPGYRVFDVTEGVAYATIFLSITLVTGMGGQISLCQATFAGVGAFTAGQLAERFDVPILGGIVAGAVVAAAVGALVALPALRLGGLHLALATLAFALMVDNVVFPLDWVGGGAAGIAVPRPLVGPFDLAADRVFFVLALGVLVLAAVVVILVRKGTTGRYLAAIRGSEVAASSIGIDPVRAKITVFALSAAIAGTGGGVLASLQGQVGPQSFSPFDGLFWVVIVASLGSRTVDGAIAASFVFVLLARVLDEFGVSSQLQEAIPFAVFGLAAISFARHPEGVFEAQKRWVAARASRALAPA